MARRVISNPRIAAAMHHLPQLVSAAATEGIRKGASQSIPYMRRRTRRAPPASRAGLVGAVATERYLWNWQSEGIPGGARVFNDQPYAHIIELGLAPRTEIPPEANLVRWLAYRFGMDPSSRRTWKIARAICLSIWRRGLRPRRVMIGSVGRVADVCHVAVVRSIEEVLNAL